MSISIQKNKADQVIGASIIIDIRISNWKGLRTLREDEIGISIPSKYGKSPEKFVFPKKRLAIFDSCRRRVNTRLLSIGTGWAKGSVLVDSALEQDVNTILAEEESIYKQEVRNLEKDYQSELLTYHEAADNDTSDPIWAPILKAAAMPWSDVEHRFEFGFLKYKIGRVGDDDGLDTAVESTTKSLYSEVAGMAAYRLRDMAKSSKQSMDQRGVNSIRAIVKKLRACAYIDHNATAIADHCEEVIASFPLTGEISGKHYNDNIVLLSALKDSENVCDLLGTSSKGPTIVMPAEPVVEVPKADPVQPEAAKETEVPAAKVEVSSETNTEVEVSRVEDSSESEAEIEVSDVDDSKESDADVSVDDADSSESVEIDNPYESGGAVIRM